MYSVHATTHSTGETVRDPLLAPVVRVGKCSVNQQDITLERPTMLPSIPFATPRSPSGFGHVAEYGTLAWNGAIFVDHSGAWMQADVMGSAPKNLDKQAKRSPPRSPLASSSRTKRMHRHADNSFWCPKRAHRPTAADYENIPDGV